MLKIAPSILSADFTNLEKEIRAVEEAGADVIHIDVMDGHFVPNITIGPLIVEAVNRCTELPLDVHLMIENPDAYIPDFIKAGADWITVHIEACPHIQRTLTLIRDNGTRCGVVLNPGTALSSIESVLADTEIVLLMSVNPGFGGQKFLPSTIKKIEGVKKMIAEQGVKVAIEVDGGITPENSGDVIRAGGEILVAGSAVYKTKDYKEAIKKLKGL